MISMELTLSIGDQTMILGYDEGKTLFDDLKSIFDPTSSTDPFGNAENYMIPITNVPTEESIAPKTLNVSEVPKQTKYDKEADEKFNDEMKDRFVQMQKVIDNMNEKQL